MTASSVRGRETTRHIFPRDGGWVLFAGHKTEPAPAGGQAFDDLGRALDAATAGDRPVHVVVHEREAA